MSRRTFWILVVALCLVAAGLSLWLPREAAARRVSDLYRRYEPNPHLSVAFIEGFKVNDTLSVDVTLLQALDDEGWDILKEDFRVVPPVEFIQKKIDSGKDIVEVFLAPKDNPTLPMDKKNILKNNVVGVSRLKHSIGIFNIETEGQMYATLHYNYRIQ